ncbi:Linoleate 9/13-lipoxygenase precursor [Gemmata sp. SH-PL17]|uniref:lipoxygenase family protein n=1 Tax=Gemmata sp. SH-PL17 TaxID=1630693 RepID=UPI000696132A|nr:lipoxygenase family protein [Gemmata sp. SH-PL17]AMV28430.1 Linoleate 9/13-lipoxygenase precursor [Gemmata sp. SH-PL17]
MARTARYRFGPELPGARPDAQVVHPMSAFLPAFDPDPETRAAGRAAKRGEYTYNHEYVSPLAFVGEVPSRDRFPIDFTTLVLGKIMTNVANQADADSALRRRLRAMDVPIADMVLAGSTAVRAVGAAVGAVIGAAADARRLQTIDDYNALFHVIGLPPIAKDFEFDSTFAELRLAGPNPVMIHRVDKPDDRFPVTDAHFQVALPGDTLAAAGAEGRLFLVDYQRLDGVETGVSPCGLPKYLYAPLALFAVNKDTRKLVPVAIQCKQRPGPENPIFTPDDGYNWRIAKTIVEIADGNYHEAITHLGRTHLTVEPFVVAAHRQFGPNHPLNVLLQPHFGGTLAINHLARLKLISPDGVVDRLLGAKISAALELSAWGVQGHAFMDLLPPASFRRRGVDNTATLPSYSYRDDALLHWEAVREWVATYLRCFYRSDAEVAADVEVAAWLTEASAKTGGRINGIEPARTFAELVDVTALVIFTASAQHAAVNFPQYDIMSYAPAMPLAGYAPAPTSKTGATEADYMAMLPPRDQAALQMNTGFMLGTAHYTRLGHYEPGYFGEPRINELAARFAAKMDEIEATITERNRHRRPYPFMLPSGVPQSINI